MTKLTRFVSGVNTNFSTELNANNELAINDNIITKIDQLIDRDVTRSNDKVSPFVEAYVNADGRKNSVVTANNSAVFDTNKYKADGESEITHTIPSGTFLSTVNKGIAAVNIVDWEDGASLQWKAKTFTGPFVVIEATTISSSSDFEINNCGIIKIATGKWLLGCKVGSDEVKRAQIYKTLFYGTDGTNARASSTYIAGITALKTSVSRDVGKRAYNVFFSLSGASGSLSYTGTFTNTTTNNSVSSWSYLTSPSSGLRPMYWELPNNTQLNQANAGNHFGTDRSSDEANNPANCRLTYSHTIGFTFTGRAVVLSSGGITWVQSGSGTTTKIDFTADNSIPVMTATTETLSGDTGWKDFNISGDTAYAKISDFTPFTAEPTEFIVKLIPKTTSPTAGVPSVAGAGIKLI